MNRLAVLLIGINVAALIFSLGFAPQVGSCSWPTGDFVAHYVNCHQTDHVLPLMLGLAVLSASYYYYRRAEPSPAPAVPHALRPTEGVDSRADEP